MKLNWTAFKKEVLQRELLDDTIIEEENKVKNEEKCQRYYILLFFFFILQLYSLQRRQPPTQRRARISTKRWCIFCRRRLISFEFKAAKKSSSCRERISKHTLLFHLLLDEEIEQGKRANCWRIFFPRFISFLHLLKFTRHTQI